MFTLVRRLLELIRFSHTVFALPFALLSGLLGWVYRAKVGMEPAWRWSELAGIVLCMVFARSAAMAFNRIADRRLDAENPRTRERHLPAGLLSLATVAAFFVGCGLGFVAATVLFLPNRWPLYLCVPVLLFVCGYSYAKRFTVLAHFWLGAALMLAPVCVWIALLGFQNVWPSVVLGGAVLFWVAGFDIIYACQDVEADQRLGLFSLPARLGVGRALRVAAVCHLATLVLLFALPAVFPWLGWVYLAGVVGAAILLVYEHVLVRPDDLTRLNQAFFQVNAVISLGLLIVAGIDLWALAR
jgi:4-hydroxybenzoate polyprenyltransferase